MGGQINPNGSESINLNLVEKLTIGKDKAWVRLPDLKTKRHARYKYQYDLFCFKSSMTIAGAKMGVQ